MATVNVIYSMTVQDAKGSRASIPIYALLDTATTIGALEGAMATFSEYFDSLTEAKIVGHSISLELTPAVTWKAAAVANSDVEEGALFSFPLTNLPSKSYGVEIPAFLQSKFVGNEVDTADIAVADLITALTTPGTINPMNNLWSSTLASPVRKAYKTFRKRNR